MVFEKDMEIMWEEDEDGEEEEETRRLQGVHRDDPN